MNTRIESSPKCLMIVHLQVIIRTQKVTILLDRLLVLEHLQLCSACDSQNIFFTSKFSHLLFSNPTHKPENGMANRCGGLLIANHLDQSLWWANQKNWAAVRSHFVHCFLEVHRVVARHASATPQLLLEVMLSQNYFTEPNRHVLTFYHSIVLVRITYWGPLKMLFLGHQDCLGIAKQFYLP
jgi:hypothetical protein